MDTGCVSKAVQGGVSVVDVRPLEEFTQRHLAGAIYVAFNRRTLPRVLRACVDPGDLILIASSDDVGEAARRLVPTEEGYRPVQCVTVGRDGRGALAGPTEWLELTTGNELAGRLEASDRGFRLLDVREPFEWRLGVIEGSTLLSLRDVRAAALGWDSAQEVVCVCEEGFRSASAASVLKKQGIRTAKSLTGGIAEWFRAGRLLHEP